MCQINTARAKTRLGNLHVVGRTHIFEDRGNPNRGFNLSPFLLLTQKAFYLYQLMMTVLYLRVKRSTIIAIFSASADPGWFELQRYGPDRGIQRQVIPPRFTPFLVDFL